MQLPPGQHVRVPRFHRVNHPVDQLELAIHHMTRYAFKTQSAIPDLRTVYHDKAGMISPVGGRVTERVVLILIAVEDTRDFVLFRIGQELMSRFGYLSASSY